MHALPDQDDDEDGLQPWPDDEAALLMGEGTLLGELEPPRAFLGGGGARMNGAAVHGLMRQQGANAGAAVEVRAAWADASHTALTE